MFNRIRSIFYKGGVVNKDKRNDQSDLDAQSETLKELSEKNLAEVRGGIMKTKHDTAHNSGPSGVNP